MNLSDDELYLGQLALARGKVELFDLLECTSRAASTTTGLEEALVDSRLMSRSEIETLREEIEVMDRSDVDDLVEQGETMALQTLADNERNHRTSRVDDLADPVEVAKTIRTPPSDASSDDDRQLPSFENRGRDDGDRYEILDELGRGGMGQILRARDHVLDREIALKTLLEDADTDQPREQLLAEARLTGQLEHPSIVPVYEVGRLRDDQPYYTMRVVPDHSLRTTIWELETDPEDAPSMLRLAQILRQVCFAVHFAHENGVIHRDLKPENILLGDYGEVFVIDWGIAKVLRDVDDVPSPTTDRDNEPGSVVGTPQYMAPEQARGKNDQIDERADIYALGSILYELMTLTAPFEDDSVMGLLLQVVRQPPEPPSSRAPHRSIPQPLEEICLKALAKDPADRYRSAQALADELDLFIEGVKDRDRNQERARELIEEAEAARRDYRDSRRRLEEAIRERNELRDEIPGWAPDDQRDRLWELEDRVENLEVQVEQKFGETTRLLSQSLGQYPLDEAHDALASMYWQRFREAERRDDRQMAAHFENLVRRHDTGAFADRLAGRADLLVDADNPEAELTLYEIVEHKRRLVAGDQIIRSHSKFELADLPHGRYRLVAQAPGHAPIRMPIALDRGETRNLQVRLWPRESVPEDFAVVPGGEFPTGPPEEFGLGETRQHLPDFAIQRTPVTCRQYLEFLNDLAEDDLERARRHAPRPGEETDSYFPIVDGRFVLPESDPEGDAWHPDWPIFMVNHHDATAFARWRSERDGREYRLPTSLQWEKAARGTDGRLFPWGSHFDPSFCRMRESTDGKPTPAPVQSYSADTSPYGLADMAGNICEWTNTVSDRSTGVYAVRGGAYNSISLICRTHWYQESAPTFRHTHYGFRLALELSETDSEDQN